MTIDFSPVNAFQQMRQNLEPNFAPVQKPQAPDIAPGIEAAGAYGGTNIGRPGHLVDFNGFQIAGSVLPYAQQIKSLFPGLRLSSAYRDPGHNASVGGVANSFHLSGRAIDWSGSSREMQAAEAWAKAHGATEAMIHSVPGGGGFHLHTAWG